MLEARNMAFVVRSRQHDYGRVSMPYVVGFAGTSNLLDTSDGIACCSKCGSGSIQISLASGSSRCCWNVSCRDLQ